jgi:arylsulfatase A-like enzyme
MNTPNILLIVLDAVRAKNCSLYDHANNTTPFLETFAETAVRYDQARSPGTDSITSHTSIFTGYAVSEHETTAHEARVDPEATIWEKLRVKNGYATGLFTPNLIVAGSSNLSEPFDTVVSPDGTAMNLRRQKLFDDAFDPTDIDASEGIGQNFKRALSDDSPMRSLINCGWRFLVDLEQSYRPRTEHKIQPAHKYANAFLDWHSSQDRPWAACLNFMDAHRPYKPQAEFDEWGGAELHDIHDSMKAYHDVLDDLPWWKLQAIEALYDGGIRQSDDAIERIVSELKTRNDFEDTFIVITSDHGQGFGERSITTPEARMVKHSWGVHEVLTHVPLVVKYPGQTQKRQVSELATIQNFPNAVHSVVEGTVTDGDPFVADGEILVSTPNLKQERAKSLPDSEMIPFLKGPWKAVYREDADGVVKYIRRGEDGATVRVLDERTAYQLDDDDGGIVAEAYSSVTPANIKLDEANVVSDQVNDRLRELGYLRD